MGARAHKNKGRGTLRRAAETEEERERRKMEAVYSSSTRNKDSGMEREDKVKRLVGGWRSGSVLEFFLAWRELAVSLRDIQQARERVKSYTRVLSKRAQHRTDADLETLYGFVIEKAGLVLFYSHDTLSLNLRLDRVKYALRYCWLFNGMIQTS